MFNGLRCWLLNLGWEKLGGAVIYWCNFGFEDIVDCFLIVESYNLEGFMLFDFILVVGNELFLEVILVILDLFEGFLK